MKKSERTTIAIGKILTTIYILIAFTIGVIDYELI